jgi:predicted nucleotidyltransferase
MDQKVENLLISLKSILKQNYGKDLSAVYLFGSQTSSFNPDSDFDVMLVFKEFKDWKEIKEILDLITDFGIDNDIVFDAKVYFENDLNNSMIGEIPFVKNVIETGIKI